MLIVIFQQWMSRYWAQLISFDTIPLPFTYKKKRISSLYDDVVIGVWQSGEHLRYNLANSFG